MNIEPRKDVREVIADMLQSHPSGFAIYWSFKNDEINVIVFHLRPEAIGAKPGTSLPFVRLDDFEEYDEMAEQLANALQRRFRNGVLVEPDYERHMFWMREFHWDHDDQNRLQVMKEVAASDVHGVCLTTAYLDKALKKERKRNPDCSLAELVAKLA